MKLKATGLLLAMAMMLGVAAMPASAATSVGAHTGVFIATAKVGKFGSCGNDGVGTTSGGTIGLLPLPTKNAYYTIEAAQGQVVDAPNGPGNAQICGRLTAPLQDTPLDVKGLTGIGASCMSTKGWGGSGKATFANQTIYLSNLGWKITVGGTFLVTADAGGVSKKKADLLVAQVQAINENVLISCVNKTLGDKNEPAPFTVAATYEIIPGAGNNVPKKAPKK